MKVVNRRPQKTADVSSAKGNAGRELRQLLLSAAVLLIILFFVLGWTVDYVVARISFETEAKVFNHVRFPVPEAKDPPEPADLEKAGAILAKLQKDPAVPPLSYRLVLIEQEEPNAFAFPGGTIGVTTGLLDMLDEEIEVAFVLGHELGHFHHRDHLQGMGRAIGFRIIMAIIFGAGDGAESFGNMIEFVFQRGYSQEGEKAADRFGLELVQSVYGKTEGVDRLFHILLDEDKTPGWAYMFSTHPSPRSRIDDLRSYAAALAEEYSKEPAADRKGK